MKPIEKSKIAFSLILSIFYLFACQNKQSENSSVEDFHFQWIEHRAENSIQEGDEFLVDMLYKTKENQVIADSRLLGGSFEMKYIDSIWQDRGLFYLGLRKMGKGDSAHFMIPAQNFYQLTASDSLPEILDKNDTLIFQVRLSKLPD